MKYLRLPTDLLKIVESLHFKVDTSAFLELFQQRMEDEKIKINRSLEIFFKNDPSIQGLINEFHQKQKVKEESELKVALERLSECEKKLESKVTKTAQLQQQRLNKKIKKLQYKLQKYDSHDLHDYDYRIYPLYYAPLIIWENDCAVMKPFRFQCRPMGVDESFDREHQLYKAKKESLTEEYFIRIGKYGSKKSLWNDIFGKKHGVLLLDGFFEYSKKGKSVGFAPHGKDYFMSPCLFDQWKSEESILNSFAIITEKASESIMKAGYHRNPVMIDSQHLETWLNPQDLSNQELHTVLGDQDEDHFVEIAS